MVDLNVQKRNYLNAVVAQKGLFLTIAVSFVLKRVVQCLCINSCNTWVFCNQVVNKCIKWMTEKSFLL